VSGDSYNYGIAHSGTGDVINTGVQNFGVPASASSAEQSAREQFARFRELLAEHENKLSVDEQTDVNAQLAAIETQLKASGDKRNRARLTDAISALTKAVGSVASLVSGAGALGQVIEQLFH
jgi:hypothetical protein